MKKVDFARFVKGKKSKVKPKKIIKVSGVSNYTCLDCGRVYGMFVKEGVDKLPEVFECLSCKGPAIHVDKLDYKASSVVELKKGVTYFDLDESGVVVKEV